VESSSPYRLRQLPIFEELHERPANTNAVPWSV
jgi:hypothetical protein